MGVNLKHTDNDNIIKIGKKSVIVYVVAGMYMLNNNPKDILIMARGKSISKAVDVAEILRSKFNKKLKYEIETKTEELTPSPGRDPLNVSCIEITLKRD